MKLSESHSHAVGQQEGWFQVLVGDRKIRSPTTQSTVSHINSDAMTIDKKSKRSP